MAEIKFTGPVYKVTMTEYERGWGQRPMGEKYFDTEEEAKKVERTSEWNAKISEGQKGRVQSPETRAKISVARKQQRQTD